MMKKKAKANATATKATTTTPAAVIAQLPEERRAQVARLDAFIRKTVPQLKPFVHGAMLAYGSYHYKYASGREGDWFRIGVASQKAYISLYACGADERGYVAERYKERLPKANVGKSCVRFKRFDDLDPGVLRELLQESARSGFGM
jgi:hypothetical protein